MPAPGSHRSRRPWRAAALAAAGLASAAAVGTAAPPQVDLLVTRERITAEASRGVPAEVAELFAGSVPPVAFLVNRGGPLDVAVRRTPGTDDWEAARLVDGVSAPVPAEVPAGPRGLGRAVVASVLDRQRRVVRRVALTVCPGAGALRLGPGGPAHSGFPSRCSSHPFARGVRLGLDTDYGVPIDLGRVVGAGLRAGRYTVRLRVRPATAAWLGMPADGRSATLRLLVRPARDEDGAAVEGDDVLVVGLPGAHQAVNVPAPAADPPADTLPDLAALPAYGFRVVRTGRRDMLDFNATVWNAGPGPLIVEGFRRGGAPRMDAYQFFRREDADVAAVRVGDLDYDFRSRHDHWHFRDFARYSLVRPDGSPVVTSPKEAWCLAPTDVIDQLVPNAALEPGDGLLSSACGEASAPNVREVLEAGAGDTYTVDTPGQPIDVTRVPNGTYALKIEANPAGRLREVTRADDVALRTIVLAGRPGRRTVSAPPADGVDTEGWARRGRPLR